ncbi:MAG TPA: hypothetical protein VFZ23_17070 [Pyrinomonadaceae bacterium]
MKKTVNGKEVANAIEAPEVNANGGANRKYLLLSTSLLVDRVYLHTGLLSGLSRTGEVEIWASSYSDPDGRQSWDSVEVPVKPFPQVRAFREMPHNYLRRLNEFVWDFRYLPASRLSMMEHVRNKNYHYSIRALKGPARMLAMLRSEEAIERNLEKLLLSYPRSNETEARFRTNRPSVVVLTGPFQFEQPAVYSSARKFGIPTIAYIPSWDNVTTKNRMVFGYDAYIVWNEKVKQELLDFYPDSRRKPIYVVGPPQFDVFYQERFFESREEFCRKQQLDPALPIIVYAVGSPNFLKEHHGAVHLAKRVAEGKLGNVQMLVRPHPIHDNAEMRDLFGIFGHRVRLQESTNAGKQLTKRTQDVEQITEWVNTFRHAAVVVNLSSTVTVDASIFDKPVVNLDFDPQPGQFDQQLIKEVNHSWPHFKPIAESGGVWLVNNFEELEHAVKTYLERPELHRQERKWVVEHVCGFTDGTCGERMAAAILDFLS